jgi:hypothetical protein
MRITGKLASTALLGVAGATAMGLATLMMHIIAVVLAVLELFFTPLVPRGDHHHHLLHDRALGPAGENREERR